MRVGVVQFGSSPRLEISLDECSTTEELTKRLKKITYRFTFLLALLSSLPFSLFSSPSLLFNPLLFWAAFPVRLLIFLFSYIFLSTPVFSPSVLILWSVWCCLLSFFMLFRSWLPRNKIQTRCRIESNRRLAVAWQRKARDQTVNKQLYILSCKKTWSD